MTAQRPQYQVEPRELGDVIWGQGHITPWQFLRICSWKSAKGLASLCMNDEGIIIERTTEVCDRLRWAQDLDVVAEAVDWTAWEDSVAWAVGSQRDGTGLLGLHGVGYPVATAVLCILNPRAFPVLDRWSLQGLYGPTAGTTTSYARAARYRTYTTDLLQADLGLDEHATVHERDQEAMRRGMPPGQVPEIPREGLIEKLLPNGAWIMPSGPDGPRLFAQPDLVSVVGTESRGVVGFEV